ncbi:glutathione S-transferase theta-1 [Strongylocentrotus purpuratus]|uniref:glutathione transferase n=1 Tax=Strongylocentrotus purpuratus TaxID=7668 RepID=A0A7M7TG65_STRPU|nr:glutathione S-transferase theta-1 [Strongylocentrotus purpuratus]|eukprot:XP_780057.1 PREDICTED: glutathione S-transferase theta-1 [Strongylocentrotus purpuratus]
MVVKVYVDYRSQPCRALVLFLKNTKIPFEIVLMDLIKGDHKKPDYGKVTLLRTSPAIKDGDFSMAETVAIIRYLATKYADLVPDHWYPKDLKKRARVDEYMAFHHTGTRGACFGMFASEVGIPLFTGGKQHASEERLKRDEENLTKQLDKLETAFLRDNDWLAGDDISVADMLAVPEMMQNTINGRDVTEGRPKLKAYVDRVKNRLNPVFDEVHEVVYAWRDSYNK